MYVAYVQQGIKTILNIMTM